MPVSREHWRGLESYAHLFFENPYVPDLPFKTGAQIAFPLSGCAVLAFASETF